MLLMLVPTMVASLPQQLSHHLPAGGFPLSTVQHTRLLERALLSQSVLLFSLACYSAVCLSDCLSCVPTPSGPFTLSLSPSHCPSKSLALTLLLCMACPFSGTSWQGLPKVPNWPCFGLSTMCHTQF